MSLINDALKRARRTPPKRTRKSTLTPLPAGGPPPRPAGRKNNSSPDWFLPVIIIFLIVVACFFIGLAMASHTVTKIVNAPEPGVSATQSVVEASAPEPKPMVVEPVVSNEPPPLKVQGIAFDPSKPWAIINGKTVFIGDPVGEFRVKAISKYTVTLAGADGKEKTVTLGE
jgi:hypothetical protein